MKICCIASRREAALAVRHGANAVGLVSAMPSGPGPIPEETIADIVLSVPPGIATFLLTSLHDPGAIASQQRRTGADTIQLVDRVGPGTREELRRRLPGVSLVQVVHVLGEGAIDEARQAATHADAILLDSGDPTRAVKELGGTGRTHDWVVSREIVKGAPVPIYLAGGLRPENVAEAIERVRPFGVDLCSGVRVGGALDEERLASFMAAVRQAGSRDEPASPHDAGPRGAERPTRARGGRRDPGA